MKPYEISEGGLLISDDQARLDRALIHAFLSGRSYWAQGIPREVMDRSLEHSLCFGMYRVGHQGASVPARAAALYAGHPGRAYAV